MARTPRFDRLATERRNRASAALDRMDPVAIASLMNREDARAVRAVGRVRHAIARAVGRRLGAATMLVGCNPASARGVGARVVIAPTPGPEVLAGSTRLKAGTATKLVLNTLTTASMSRLGRVHGNRMIDVQPRSRKLRERALRLVAGLARVPRPRARRALTASGGRVRVAIVIVRTDRKSVV